MSKTIRRILLFLCAAVFLYSVFRLAGYYIEYRKGDAIYEEAKSFVISVGNSETTEEEIVPTVNFEELKKVNEDIFAWIQIEETPVDYPVLLGRDNAYYLNRTYDHQYSSFGSIFLDKDNAADWSDRHTIVYGHNMKNKSMFGSLASFQKQEYFEEHPLIHIETPEGSLVYEIFSVYTAFVLDPTYEMAFADDHGFQTMLDHMNATSVISSERVVGVEDRVLTLSTCTPAGSVNKRFVVNAVLIEDLRGQE